MNLFRLCFVLTMFLASTMTLANAAPLVSMQEVMSFFQVPTSSISGDVEGQQFDFHGEMVQLKPYLQDDDGTIAGGSVHLESVNDEKTYFTFPLTSFPFFTAYKITDDEGTDFLLIESGKAHATNFECTGLWLIGLYKNQYVTFANLDTVRRAGLQFQTIVPSIAGGELNLMGIVPDNPSFVWHGYGLHAGLVPQMTNVQLFWDDKAQWFGIRQAS